MNNNTHSKIFKEGRVTKTDTRVVSVENCENNGTVKVIFDHSTFVDFLECFVPIAEATTADIARKQDLLNFAFKQLISTSGNYRDENIGAMMYFNQLCSSLQRSVHLFYFLHDVLEDYREKEPDQKLSNKRSPETLNQKS